MTFLSKFRALVTRLHARVTNQHDHSAGFTNEQSRALDEFLDDGSEVNHDE